MHETTVPLVMKNLFKAYQSSHMHWYPLWYDLIPHWGSWNE